MFICNNLLSAIATPGRSKEGNSDCWNFKIKLDIKVVFWWSQPCYHFNISLLKKNRTHGGQVNVAAAAAAAAELILVMGHDATLYINDELLSAASLSETDEQVNKLVYYTDSNTAAKISNFLAQG